MILELVCIDTDSLYIYKFNLHTYSKQTNYIWCLVQPITRDSGWQFDLEMTDTVCDWESSVFIKEIILKNFFSIRSQKHNLKTVFITKKL